MPDGRLDSKEAWRTAVGLAATELEMVLWERSPGLDYGHCLVCQKAFGSLANHLQGQAHWKGLGYKLAWQWPSHSADLVQRWDCADGRTYFFNHLTAEHGETETLGCCPAAPTAGSAPPPPPASARVVAPEAQAGRQEHAEQQPAPAADGSTLRCTACQQVLERSHFHKSQQKWSLEDRQCIQCREGSWAAERLATCTQCQRQLDASLFRHREDWANPTCKECREASERQQYEQWQAQREQERLAREMERQEMDEAALRQYFADEITQRAAQVPSSHLEAMGAEAPQLWTEVVQWAERLCGRVQREMQAGRLSTQWRDETPSREHALDTAAAARFKDLEDLGDRLVHDHAAQLYMELVAGERVKVYRLEDLRAELQRDEGGRSWHLADASMVIAALRPEGGWQEGSCQQRDLRAEPRSGAVHAGPHMFAQLDDNAHDALFGSQPLLRQGARVEVKMIRSAFWRDLEQDLYHGKADVGSHNQVFSRAYGCAGGAAAGANRTEVMNLFADLLGFFDDDPAKPRASLGRAIWAEAFGHLFSPRLLVCYGVGREFRADALWPQKMEANVAEALIGALAQDGFEELSIAAAALCLICYGLWPRGVLPSNWSMAEKVLALECGDTFLRRHLDAAAVRGKMERLLRPTA